ncbi:DUF6701 domain-containing protein [Vibrio mytili]|uniref:DUF6701 domain-containing protein n=1 Tax=Vibrio mytili TaxID=50718 RepID=A0A0C3E4C4_9VIBR|nr:DUF6701 domain-containing protein [Vibrio mytili]KIN09203.1 hypothetical protein SU60_20830 [Vibrio mytili]
MKKLIFLALIWMMSTATVLAKEYDITPEANYSRWWIVKYFDGWTPKNADNLCNNGYLEGKDSENPVPTTYVCPNGLTLKNGDTIVSDSKMTIRVRGTIQLAGNNQIGKSNAHIDLINETSDVIGDNGGYDIYGDIESHGKIQLKNRSHVYGSILSTHGEVILSQAVIEGNVTSKTSTIKTEQSDNIIRGNVEAAGTVTLKQTHVEGSVTSIGGEVKTEQSGNEIQGNISASSRVTLNETKVTGDVTSKGLEVILEANNQVHGNILALHKVDIKNSLVCGRVESTGSEVSLTNSKLDQNRGVYTLSEAIQSHGKATVKSSTVCGSVNSLSNSYDFNDSAIYCGVDDPNCQPPQTGECPIEAVASLCPELVPVIPPTQQCSLLPEENFNSGSLSNWSVMGFGTSDEPHISDGRFILNSNKPEQATASAYNYIFPSDQNYLEIEFDHNAYGGNGADGVALVISDASVPPQTGAFGGPLGYGMKLLKNHYPEVSKDVEGFAGGWLGIGIDEFGNYIREGSEKIVSNSVADNVGVRGQGVKDANGKWLKGYPYITGKKYSSSLDNRKGKEKLHRYKVVLNSRNADTITLAVFRKVGKNGGWNPVIEEFNVLKKGGFNYIPDNFRLSVTASTGMLTNTHDIDNFQVCADKYQKITEGIHHFEFDYAGTGSICQASDVTLRACMNESCTETYPSSITGGTSGSSLDPVTVSLLPVSSSAVTWEDGDSVTFSDSVALKLRANQSGSAKLGIASSSVTQFGFTGTRCRISGGDLTEENCNITFNSAALGVNTPDKIAGRPFLDSQSQLNSGYSTLPYLDFCGATSTKQAGDTGETRNITLSMEHVDPLAPDVNVPVYVAFKQQSGAFSNEVAIAPSATVDVDNVYFDNDGKALFNLRYPEVGKVKFRAQLQGDNDSKGENNFVSFPAYLEVAATSTTAKDGTCNNSDDGCSVGFVAAGEEFDMTITAYQDDGSLAKNYQEQTIAISNKVKYPSTGASAQLLNDKVPDSSHWSSGRVEFKQSVSEVGAFELKASAPIAADANGGDLGTSVYLGSSAFKIKDGNLTVGRFYPDYFKVTGTEWLYPDNQNDSVYMGQKFESVNFEVTAYNAVGGATQNYGDFLDQLKANLHLAGSYSDRLSISDSDLTSNNWSGAVWSKTWVDSVNWGKDLPLSRPDGPFNSKAPSDKDNSTETFISLSLNNDGTKISGYVDPTMFLDEQSDGTEERVVSQQLLSQPDVRYGRMVLDDIGGRQGDTLSIPLKVEYWSKNRFVVNSKDNRTAVSAVEQGDDKLIWSSPDGVTACDINIQILDSADNETSSAKVTGGILPNANRERLTAVQGCDNEVRQQSQVWLDLDDSENGLPWLKYDWDNDGSEENPSSVVTFGIHRGNDRVIYRGEPGLTGQ